jgi:RNA polymerase sigma factor (sigma-70 family)
VPHDDKPPQFDQVASELVRRKARRLVGQSGLKVQDRDDVEQELLLRVQRHLPTYDPARGELRAFLWTLIEHAAANLLRDRRVMKRDPRRTGSLQEPVQIGDEGTTELGQTVGQDAYDARRLRTPRSPEELAQLASDVADTLAGLPADLHDLAKQLMKVAVAEATRLRRVARSTLYTQVRQLRQRFERAGLRGYLENFSSGPNRPG